MTGDNGWSLRDFLIRSVVNTKAGLARFLRPGSLLVLLVVTLTGVGAALREAAVPNEGYWRLHGPLSYLLGALAAFSYLGYFFVIVGYRRILKHSDENTRLYNTCRDIANLVKRETGLPDECLGVHVWTVRGLPEIRRLERRVRYVSVHRTETNITWRRGKGVIGQCWLRDEWILADLEPMSDAQTRRKFDAIPRGARFFFNFREARATSHYKAILAWPLHGGPQNARRVVGVLSVDVQAGGAVQTLDDVWTRKRADFDAHLALCEAILK